MITITTILIILFFVDFWIDEAQDFKPLQKLRLAKLNFKPFNCGYCLSFWIGLVVALVSLNPIFVATPLIYKALLR